MTWISSKTNPGWTVTIGSAVDPSAVIFNGAACGPLDTFAVGEGEFFDIDLGQKLYIDGVRYVASQVQIGANIAVAYSDDEVIWTTIAAQQVLGLCAPNEFDVPALVFSARYVRFSIDAADSDVSYVAFEFYAGDQNTSISTANGGATMPTYTAPVDIVSGYFLNPRHGYFSIIVPEARTNLVTNPSVETNATGYTAISGATLARSTLYQQRGVYSLKITPGLAGESGAYFTTTLTANTVYSFSADVLGHAGVGYVLKIADPAGNIISQKKFTGTGAWARVACTGQTRGGGAHRLTLAKDGSTSRMDIYTDGWQCEAGAYPTTYLDGDMTGFVRQRADYRWTGTPHASTSTRSGMTRHGGRAMLLAQLGFQLLSVVGLGMPPVEPVTIEFANLDGENFQNATITSRPFTMVGQVNGASQLELQNRKLALIAALRLDNVKPRQPLVLLYQYADSCGNVSGDVLRLTCSYTGGMEGQFDNHHAEALALQFRMHLPLIMTDNERGQALNFQSQIASANYLAMRQDDGSWIGFSSNDDVLDVVFNPIDGNFLLAGEFSVISGVAANGIAQITPERSIAGYGTAAAFKSNRVQNTVDSGTFAFIDYNAKDLIFKYSNGIITQIGDSNSDVQDLDIDISGNIFVAGKFSAILPGGIRRNVAYLAPGAASWTDRSTDAGTGGDWRILCAENNNVYASTNGAIQYIYMLENNVWTSDASWQKIAYAAEGASPQAFHSMAFGRDGKLYIGGEFTQFGLSALDLTSIQANNCAVFNGTTWSALGDGLNGVVRSVVALNDGILFVGSFTNAGPINSIPSPLAFYSYGGVWTYFDIDLPGSPNVNAADVDTAEQIVIAYSTAGTATVAATNTITNSGDAPAAPIIKITGAGVVWNIRNVTTGDVIYFDLTLQDNEQVTLDLTPGNISFTSNFRGNIISTVLPGSNLTTFNLLPGVNTISVFIGGTTTSNTNATMTWRETWHSIDGVR